MQDNIPKGPFEIIISIADQRVSVYGADGLIARSKVSTGTQRHPTPLGIFSVIEKQKWHRSNMYSAAPMPYMQRITWSGVALHAGVLPGHPASHGCIRLSYDFATKLWRITKLGTRVIIAPTDAMPVEIAHPHLFTPRPGDAENLIRPRPASDIPDATINVRTAAEGPPEVAPAPAPQKRQPISIFVSRKRGKLFIRQGFKTISELPVTIDDPDKPIGTFVFTAVDIRDGDAVTRWTVVAIPDDVPHKSAARNEGSAKKLGDSSRKEDNNLGADSASDTLARASAALDRISFPSDVLDRVSQLLVPGSSLIISDYGISEETSSDTDFIIVTH